MMVDHAPDSLASQPEQEEKIAEEPMAREHVAPSVLPQESE
jgi:hypothetical protein